MHRSLVIGAPRNTPTEIVEKLNKEINAGLADPEVSRRGWPTPAVQCFCGSPADFGKLIAGETREVEQSDKVGEY